MASSPEMREELHRILSRVADGGADELRRVAGEIDESLRLALPAEGASPANLATSLLTELAHRDSERAFFARLVRRPINRDLIRAAELVGVALPARPAEVGDSPFIGLRSFSAAEEAIFFGRDASIAGFCRALLAAGNGAVVFMYGLSGVGKSSLLRAGLIPALRRQQAECRYFRCLGFDAVAGMRLEGQEDAAESAAGHQPARLITLYDQFESIFTASSAEQRATHPTLLSHVRERVMRRGADECTVLAFRQEYLADVEALLSNAGLQTAPLKLPISPMQRSDVVEVLTAPEKLSDWFRFDYEPGLVEEIAADLCDDRTAPIAPTLQLLMRELWKRRQDVTVVHDGVQHAIKRVTRTSYEEIRASGAYLHRFVGEQLPLADEPDLASAFDSGLVHDLLWFFTDEATLTGQARSESWITANFPGADVLLRVVDTYCRRGLMVVVSHGSSPDARATDRTVRLVHDALVPIILQECRTSIRPGVRAARLLRARTLLSEFERQPMPLSTEELLRVRRGRDSMHRPNPAETQILEMSEALWRTERRRRALWVWTGAVVATMLIVLAALSLWSTLNAAESGQRELTRALAFQAQHEVELGHPRAAMALAMRALELGTTEETGIAASTVDRALRTALSTRLPILERTVHDGRLRGVIAVPDMGEAVYRITLADGGLRSVPEDSAPLIFPNGDTPIMESLVASPDGASVAGAGRDGRVYHWRADALSSPAEILPNTERTPQLALAYAPDGCTLASGGSDGRVRLWAVCGSTRHELPGRAGHAGAVHALAYVAPERLATVGADGQLLLHDLSTTSEIIPEAWKHDESLYAVLTLDGGGVVYAGETGALYFRASLQRELPAFQTRMTWNPVSSLAANDDGDQLLSGHEDGTIQRWKIDDASLLVTDRFVAHQGAVRDLEIEPGTGTAASVGDDGYLRRWELTTSPGEVRTVRSEGDVRLTDVWATASEPARVITVDDGGCMTPRDPTTLESIDSAHCLSNPTQERILDRQRGTDLVVRGTSLSLTGGDSQPTELADDGEWVVGRIAANDGRVMAATSDGKLVSWRHDGLRWSREADIVTGEAPVQALALSPDGRAWMYSDTNGGLYYTEAGSAPSSLHHASVNIGAVAFSADGKWVAAGGRGAASKVEIWRRNALTNPPIELAAPGRRVTGLAFLPGDAALVAVTADGIIRRYPTLATLAATACELLRREGFAPEASSSAEFLLGGAYVCGVERPRRPSPAPSAASTPDNEDAFGFAGCDLVETTAERTTCLVAEAPSTRRVVVWLPGAGQGPCTARQDDVPLAVESTRVDGGTQAAVTVDARTSTLTVSCGTSEPGVVGLRSEERLSRADRDDLRRALERGQEAEITGILSRIAAWPPLTAQDAAKMLVHHRINQVYTLQGAGRRDGIAAVEVLLDRTVEALGGPRSTLANNVILGVVHRLVEQFDMPWAAQRVLARYETALSRVEDSRIAAHLYLGRIFGRGGPMLPDAEAALRRAARLGRRYDDLENELNVLLTLSEVLIIQRREEDAEQVLARADALVPRLSKILAEDPCDYIVPLLAVNKGWAQLTGIEAQRRFGDPRPLFELARKVYKTDECFDQHRERWANATANLAYASCLLGDAEAAAGKRAELVAEVPNLPPRVERFVQLKLTPCIQRSTSE